MNSSSAAIATGRSSSSVSSALVSLDKLSLWDLVEMKAGRGISLAPTTIMRGIGRSSRNSKSVETVSRAELVVPRGCLV
jgi:transposase-like protein